ncbi:MULTISPECIES: intracellular sulfur oxidation protein [unclassified Thermotoga]|uniref:intracellular sulfur oxidation protein n=1 Tax=unclassified Thermotoga TaxID=2631113 RepID=UPI000280EB14|nr:MULTISPECIES: intracellular sulfur oxidation protein [unclassified Thermotoga]AIY87329.1 intracellular sulfur oxidation protein [Thermotoga sp. 2812B]EJX26403.1 intracellular sulfur oxidation protein [Thermotoga sp. EMP]
MKKLLFVAYQSPVGSVWVNEAFRTAFGMYGEDLEPSVLLIEEASVALSKNTKPEMLGLLPLSICHKYIKRYGTKVYAVKQHLEKFRVKELDENFGAEVIDEANLPEFLHSFDYVIFM